MPPTVGSSPGRSGKERDRERKKNEGFVCVMKYTNYLPDIPFDAKFISYPFEANRFIQYKATSLERNYKNDLLTEPDLGVTIDLINPETYDFGIESELDPADEKLLEEEQAPQSDRKRQRQHAKTVSWLRKTEYISTEYNRFQTSNEMVETKVGHGTKKNISGMDLYKDRDGQLAAIEASFASAKRPITRHHTNSRLHPLEILPVFPDFQFWHMPCAHVIFDTEPTPRGRTTAASQQEMAQGMIRGMEDESGDQFVAYFLPTESTLESRRQHAAAADANDVAADEAEYEYKLAREYNWNVQNKAIKGFEENYFFVLREQEGVFYNELQTRVRLNKRRGKGGAGGVSSSVSKLVVKTREPTENEVRLQNARLMQLENIAHDEEDEDDDEESDLEDALATVTREEGGENNTGEERASETTTATATDTRPPEDIAKREEDNDSNDSADDLFRSSSSEGEGE